MEVLWIHCSDDFARGGIIMESSNYQRPIKEGLAAYNGKRILVEGVYANSDSWYDAPTRRNYPTVCLQFPEKDGVVLADHVWTHHAQKIKDAVPQRYEKVRFTAIVREYRKDSGGKDYCLDVPENVSFPDRDVVAVRIPEERKPEAPPPISAANAAITPEPIGSDPVALLKKVKAVAKEAGGWDKLADLISILRD